MSSRTKNIETFDEVLALCKSYLSKEESISFITRAYDFAREKHEGQFRKTGEPYIIHLINVAYYLAELQVGPSTLAAGFLHDTIEDCGVKKAELAVAFNEDVATLVEAVSKVSQLSYKQKRNFRPKIIGKSLSQWRKIFEWKSLNLLTVCIICVRAYAQLRKAKEKLQKKNIRSLRSDLQHRLGINTI